MSEVKVKGRVGMAPGLGQTRWVVTERERGGKARGQAQMEAETVHRGLPGVALVTPHPPPPKETVRCSNDRVELGCKPTV